MIFYTCARGNASVESIAMIGLEPLTLAHSNAKPLEGAEMPAPLRILPRDRFGLLVVINEVPGGPMGRRFLFQCDCGVQTELDLKKVSSSHTKSCGCKAERMMHGMGTRNGGTAYSSWLSMKDRCLNPNSPQWAYYGGSGVSICAQWVKDFPAFLKEVGERPTPKHTIDRWPNNNGNYEPGNVRWATRKQQVLNRSNNIYIEINGVRELAVDVADRLGISHQAIRGRIRRGLPMEEILNPGKVNPCRPKCLCGSCRACRKRIRRNSL